VPNNRGVVRKTLIAVVILVLAVAAILGIWIFFGRQIASPLDRILSVEVASVPIRSITYEGSGTGGRLTVNDVHLSLDDSVPSLSLSIGSTKDNQFALASGGKVFAFGPLVSTAENGSDRLAVVPQPQDQAQLVTRHSLVAWPTPFEFNFMTGQSPSWKRYMYYHVIWKKPSGAAVDMLWRYEQPFYGKRLIPRDGWGSGFGTREGFTGLVQVNISP